MPGENAKATGGCLCRAVRYEMTGASLGVVYCHCTSCRKHAGAPVVALVGYRRDHMRYTSGAPKIFASSAGVGRAFCGDCGTPLTWEGDGGAEVGPMVEVLVGTMDRPEDFPPECHIHHGEHVAWFEAHDSLPRYRVWHDGEDAPYRFGPGEG